MVSILFMEVLCKKKAELQPEAIPKIGNFIGIFQPFIGIVLEQFSLGRAKTGNCIGIH